MNATEALAAEYASVDQLNANLRDLALEDPDVLQRLAERLPGLQDDPELAIIAHLAHVKLREIAISVLEDTSQRS